MIRRSLPVLLAALAVLLQSPPAFSLPSSEEQREVTRLYAKGNRMLNARRYAEAEKSFQDALKLAPEFASIHHGLGLVYSQTQDYELAVLHLEEALRRGPGQVKTQYTLAKAYLAVGEEEKALQTLGKVVEADPNFGAAHQDLAGIYYRRKNWEEAARSLERARQIDPRSAQTLMLIGVTGLHSGRTDIALDAVTQLREAGHLNRARRLEYLIFSSKQKAEEPAR